MAQSKVDRLYRAIHELERKLSGAALWKKGRSVQTHPARNLIPQLDNTKFFDNIQVSRLIYGNFPDKSA